MFKRLVKSKVAQLAVAGILTTIGAVIADKIEPGEAIKLVGVQLFALFFRDGMAKGGSV